MARTTSTTTDNTFRLPLAPTLAPLVQGDPRRAIAVLAETAFRYIQLSAALPLMRPRELDRSARRDLLALLRRHELQLAGLDLWIPVEHFADPAHADRAVSAVIDAVDLAADLGRVPLSILLPPNLDPTAIHQIQSRAETAGILIANHTTSPPPDRIAPPSTLADNGTTATAIKPATDDKPTSTILFALGIDPAAILAEGVDDPAKYILRAPQIIASARFSDAASSRPGAARVEPGKGKLDLVTYQVALLTRNYTRPVILDMRHISEPWPALPRCQSAWTSTGLLDPAGV